MSIEKGCCNLGIGEPGFEIKFTVMLAKDGMGVRSTAPAKVKSCDDPA